MANVNGRTLDMVSRTHYYRVNEKGVVVQFPFDLITIDADFQAYQPVTYRGRTEKGDAIKGSSDGAVFLDRNMALPRPNDGRTNPDKVAVWLYHGV
jgi:hypothetical protein